MASAETIAYDPTFAENGVDGFPIDVPRIPERGEVSEGDEKLSENTETGEQVSDVEKEIEVTADNFLSGEVMEKAVADLALLTGMLVEDLIPRPDIFNVVNEKQLNEEGTDFIRDGKSELDIVRKDFGESSVNFGLMQGAIENAAQNIGKFIRSDTDGFKQFDDGIEKNFTTMSYVHPDGHISSIAIEMRDHTLQKENEEQEDETGPATGDENSNEKLFPEDTVPSEDRDDTIIVPVVAARGAVAEDQEESALQEAIQKFLVQTEAPSKTISQSDSISDRLVRSAQFFEQLYTPLVNEIPQVVSEGREVISASLATSAAKVVTTTFVKVPRAETFSLEEQSEFQSTNVPETTPNIPVLAVEQEQSAKTVTKSEVAAEVASKIVPEVLASTSIAPIKEAKGNIEISTANQMAPNDSNTEKVPAISIAEIPAEVATENLEKIIIDDKVPEGDPDGVLKIDEPSEEAHVVESGTEQTAPEVLSVAKIVENSKPKETVDVGSVGIRLIKIGEPSRVLEKPALTKEIKILANTFVVERNPTTSEKVVSGREVFRALEKSIAEEARDELRNVVLAFPHNRMQSPAARGNASIFTAANDTQPVSGRTNKERDQKNSLAPTSRNGVTMILERIAA
jgi:hypothetical protein